jgi:hypothetical protein
MWEPTNGDKAVKGRVDLHEVGLQQVLDSFYALLGVVLTKGTPLGSPLSVAWGGLAPHRRGEGPPVSEAGRVDVNAEGTPVQTAHRHRLPVTWLLLHITRLRVRASAP